MMDWNRTERPRLYGKRTCLVLATYAVLLCLLPLVASKPDTEIASSQPWEPLHTDIFSDENTHHIAHHKKKTHSVNTVDEDLASSFKRWSERRKKLRNKNKLNKSKLNEDYDEMAEKHVTKKANIISNLKYLEPDKKYFDYFPIEDVQLDYDPKEEDIRVVLLLNDDEDVKKIKKSKKFARTMKKRSKRDTNEATSIAKRNVDGTYISSFIESQQGNIIPRSNSNIRLQTYSFPSSVGFGYQSHGSPNDPWNNQFTRPLNNFYLPVRQPVYPQSPVFIKYPIPGIYYNPITPPAGYLPAARPPSTPSTTQRPQMVLGNRFGAEDDRVVWDIEPNNRDQGSFSGGSAGQNGRDDQTISTSTSTRKPSPPLIHRPTGNRRPTGNFEPPTSNALGNGNENSIRPIRTTQRPRQPERRPAPTSSPRQDFPPQTEPSKCVWAIVTCCARHNLAIRYACFEQVGCNGAFWDYNPCADSLQDAALDVASTFFD